MAYVKKKSLCFPVSSVTQWFKMPDANCTVIVLEADTDAEKMAVVHL